MINNRFKLKKLENENSKIVKMIGNHYKEHSCVLNSFTSF